MFCILTKLPLYKKTGKNRKFHIALSIIIFFIPHIIYGSVSISGSGAHQISYTASSGSVLLRVTLTSSSPQSITLNSIQTQHDTTIVQPIVVNSCNNDFYRFGFNGKLKDNEWAGLGNSYDYGARLFQPRIGRFVSVDPLTKKYPWYTPYQFAGNTPIKAIDIDGAEPLMLGGPGITMPMMRQTSQDVNR